ncbi:LRR receptor-like serine/threonine-protein kinase FLS2 [Vitis vinifera]|uniref:LRR receptor-like serine/threonine-protein kinase FLS2 n=1 Tax=Vitis vinifera TaxID=29760 RepID=A0A438IZ34_VITVI|nr:LRR receptor-like serine/threonine-protein kinase FLS2 [Vitis vinifera]
MISTHPPLMAISKAIIVFPLLCFLSSTISILCDPYPLVCNETEKHALLSFKHAFFDPAHSLSSWSAQENCCGWNGVRCNNITGRVVYLNLFNFGLVGKLSPALLQLEFLNHLNLGWNDFGGTPIPSFLGSMQSLTYLDLSFASFGGLIPPQLGNLSNLLHLRLGGADSSYELQLHAENLRWISHLSSLKFLFMSEVDLHQEGQWIESTSILSSLSTLILKDCELDNMSPSLEYVNFTSLAVLSLYGNHFNHEIPNWLSNLTASLLQLDLRDNSLKGHIPITILELRYLNILYLSKNQLTGQIPEYLGQLKHLKALSLKYNSFDGPIPSSLRNLSSLRYLYLYGNRLNGTLPSSLWLLSNLKTLEIGNNSLVDTISEVHFNELSKLKYLDMSSTSLTFKVNSNWVPHFQLEVLLMSSCQMGPKFPTWLQTQTSLRNLDISKSGIVDIAPTWFWKWASHIKWIYLSDNQISGDLSGVWLNNTIIYLNSNCFTGLLPAVSPNVTVLNMANNSFSGPISHFLCQKLNGRSKLEALDLSNNDLSGELPLCWKSWQSLTHVNLGNNHFSGKIPDSISSLFSLKALHLQNNGLFGSIPSSLRDCTSLGLLDLSGNKLLGNVPNWIGELAALKVLCLRSNKFIGEIPSQICQLSSLIVLDVSDNELSGIIPRCLNNFSLMAAIETPEDLFTDLDHSNYELEGLVLMTVGRGLEYKGILKYVRMVDLSSNNFSGSIPTELSQLFGLRFLNVSKNHLMGRIPEKIGRMTSLLSLDLSINHLSGEIPQSLADLTFLYRLNLSCNQFRGRIPLSTQLQSFDAFSYIGNAQLCGVPLTKNCIEDDESQGMDTIDENEEGSEMRWFYISMGLGFIVGFWGVCGALLFKKSWRHAYFQFLYDIRDWVYVAVAIRLNWFRDNLRRLLVSETYH